MWGQETDTGEVLSGDPRTSRGDGNVLTVIGRTVGQKGTVRSVPFDRCEFYLKTKQNKTKSLRKIVTFQRGMERGWGGWNENGRMSPMWRQVVGERPTRVYSEDG